MSHHRTSRTWDQSRSELEVSGPFTILGDWETGVELLNLILMCADGWPPQLLDQLFTPKLLPFFEWLSFVLLLLFYFILFFNTVLPLADRREWIAHPWISKVQSLCLSLTYSLSLSPGLSLSLPLFLLLLSCIHLLLCVFSCTKYSFHSV